MPTYEYECEEDGHRFEVFQKFSDEPLKVCTICGAPVRRVIHAAGVIFKGQGWYVTDSRSSSEKREHKRDGKDDSEGSKKDAEPIKAKSDGQGSSEGSGDGSKGAGSSEKPRAKASD